MEKSSLRYAQLGVRVTLNEPLRQAEFLRRYKRFFADVMVDGQLVVAHVPNTGSLKSCLFEGAPCLISQAQNPARKLKATLHFMRTPSGWVGVDTSLPNQLVYAAWKQGKIADWLAYGHAQREFKISPSSRLDMVLAPNPESLERREGIRYIEVKNVSYAKGDRALFPDSVTERGQKHLLELMQLKKQGHAAELVFVIQRENCRAFAPADAIDPEYGRLLRQAVKAGVKIRALNCAIDPASGVTLAGECALEF